MKPLMLIAGETLVDMMVGPDGLIVPKLGGSPYNLAVALARLGCNVRYANPLSIDYFGAQLRAVFNEAKVVIYPRTSQCPTSLACVTVDDKGHPSYMFYREGVADRDWDPFELLRSEAPACHYFHVGSLVLIPPDGQIWLQVLKDMRARSVTTSVDVNMRLVASSDHDLYRETVRQIMPNASVLKVSDEDLVALQMTGEPLHVARGLLNACTRIVVLTLGEKGAWALTHDHEVFQAPAQVKVVDTVGAGDCFYAGFTSALVEMGVIAAAGGLSVPSQQQLQNALAFANQVTAFNLQQKGCVPPWRAQLVG